MERETLPPKSLNPNIIILENILIRVADGEVRPEADPFPTSADPDDETMAVYEIVDEEQIHPDELWINEAELTLEKFLSPKEKLKHAVDSIMIYGFSVRYAATHYQINVSKIFRAVQHTRRNIEAIRNNIQMGKTIPQIASKLKMSVSEVKKIEKNLKMGAAFYIPARTHRKHIKMGKALKAVLFGRYSITRSAKKYGIPKSTLAAKVHRSTIVIKTSDSTIQ